jgi:hypothetical protein
MIILQCFVMKTYYIYKQLFKTCFMVLLIFIGNAVLAQDSSKHKKPKTKIFPTTDFDQRFSFVAKEDANIWGYRIGVVVNEKFKVGIGGYFLNQDTSVIRYDRSGNPIAKLQRNLYFGTIYYEPFLFRKKYIEMSIVFEAGYGNAVLDSNIKAVQGRTILYKTNENRQAFVPIGVGISYNFKMPDIKHLHFLTYVGINAMAGLRKTIFESDLRSGFDGWYWSIGGAVFLDKMVADLKGHKKKSED